MKCKRVLALVLALLLAAPMAVLPASAVTFPDVTGNWTWAAGYISDMAGQGIFKGYEDGTFGPGRELTTGQALAICARSAGLTAAVYASISADRADEVTGIFGTAQDWFHADFAVCLELGIVSSSELKSLRTTGAIDKSISKQDFAFYLVRAMGLEELAKSLETYSMNFADSAAISVSRRPYVYLLTTYGVVEGTEENKFEPNSTLNRAVAATMLSRVVSFVKARGIVRELPRYTSYSWTAGLVAGVSSGAGGPSSVTLKNGGVQRAVSVPPTAVFYQNNMPVTQASLTVGMYARACLSASGAVTSVRILPASQTETLTGTVTSLSREALSLKTADAARVLALDRFTSVTVGGVTGDYTLIDDTSDYTEAICLADRAGRLLMVELTGGTTLYTGLIRQVKTEQTVTELQIICFDGVTQAFQVPEDAEVSVNGLAGTLKSGHVGSYIEVRASNDVAGQAEAAAVNTAVTYVQGSVRGITYTSSPSTLQLVDHSTGKAVTYKMAAGAGVTYNGGTILFQNVQKDWLVTARLNGIGEVERLEAYPGRAEVKGQITRITYATVTVLYVTDDSGVVYAFNLDMTDLPDIERNGALSTIDKLRVGDDVTVTLRFYEVTLIESEQREANLKGTITRIVQETAGNTLELTLTDGTPAAYQVGKDVEIVKDDRTVALSALQPGDVLELTLSGDRLVAIRVADSATSSTDVTGTILYVNVDGKSILLQTSDAQTGSDRILTVNVTTGGTRYLEVDGTTLSLRDLQTGDRMIAYGTYSGAEFYATLVLRK